MTWSHTLHDLAGNLYGTIEAASSPTNRVANDASDGTHSFVLEEGNDWGPILCETHATIIAKAWNGVVHYAGYVESVTSWDAPSSTITLKTVDARDELANRLFFPVDEPNYRAGTLMFAGKSHTGAVHAILTAAATGRGPGWDLPLVIPADEAGDLARIYWYWDMHTPDDALIEIQDLDDGPDLDFEPRYRSDGGLEWVVRVGQPRLSGPDLEYNLTASENGVTKLGYQLNGQLQRSGAVAAGKGSEVDMRVGFANNLPGPTMIVRDRVDAFKDLEDPGELIGHAYGNLWAHRWPTEQWALTVSADCLDQGLRIGSRVSVYTSGDRVIADGWHDLYCIGFKTTLSVTDVELQLQPLRETP